MSWRARFRDWLKRDSAALIGMEREQSSELRDAMVRNQIERRDVRDPRVLAAMRKVERHRFVPPEIAASAADDKALTIGFGQTISQPYMVAKMTELLELAGHEKVLEVGTGSGYQAAILGEVAREVWTIEVLTELHVRAKALLSDLGYENVHCVLGDGNLGLPEQAPFEAILVAAAPRRIPQALIDQLADGGRLVIPVGERKQELVRIEKRGGTIVERRMFAVQFVPLVER